MMPSINTLIFTLSFSAVLSHAGPDWGRADFVGANIEERAITYNIADMNQQLAAAKPYVRFELADTANRTTLDSVIVFDVTNCGDTNMDKNTVRAHQRVDTIEPAMRKCQSFFLQPQIASNTYGIHVSDGTSPYGFVTSGGNSPAVSITATDPMWQESEQYQLQCFTAPKDPNAKDTNGRRYFGKQCRIMIVGSGKCLAATGYNDKKNATNYDLDPVACDNTYKDLEQIWNVENTACSFTQDNHDMSVPVDKIKAPPKC